MKKFIRRSVYISVFVCLSIAIVSCEEDFADIGSNVISNTKFNTDVFLADITLENSPLEKVQTDNISSEQGQYLLGVFANEHYEKLEASIISQVGFIPNLKLVDKTYGLDTTVVSKIDTVFIKLPYQSTLENSTTSSVPLYSLDSIIGDVNEPFNLNIYETSTYLSYLNPTDPSKKNSYFSDFVFEKKGIELNSQSNIQFIPNEKDTVIYVKRRTSNNLLITTDTIKYLDNSSATNPIPFARIPLKEDRIKELFLDKYESTEFNSQDAFNNYFRGIILEATGNKGSLISFKFNNVSAELNPSIEVFYTNTVLNTITRDTIKTFRINNSFPLAGVRTNTFKMDNKVYPVNNEVKIQGAAGSEVKIDLFGNDSDNNGIADKIEELRSKNWLINDATLTFYIDQSKDTIFAPNRLYLFKNDETTTTNPVLSQIKDATSEAAIGGIGGYLLRDSNGKKEKYTFKITDYISDLLNGETNYSPELKLKVFNPTDLPASITDTIFRNESWNPKAVTLFNHSSNNGAKKAELKISYSEKK